MENQKSQSPKRGCASYASFARAFYWGLFALLLGILRESGYLSLRAFARMRGNQQARNPKTVDCFALLAMTHPLPPEHREGEMEAGFSRTPFVIASEHSERGNQTYVKLESWGFCAD